ncbi:MAG: DUF1328 domain-containing protein [Luteolibacter sp.]
MEPNHRFVAANSTGLRNNPTMHPQPFSSQIAWKGPSGAAEKQHQSIQDQPIATPIQKDRSVLASSCQPVLAAMLSWSLLFLTLAVVAGLLGFIALTGMIAWIARILFFVFLTLLVISAIRRASQGRTP